MKPRSGSMKMTHKHLEMSVTGNKFSEQQILIRNELSKLNLSQRKAVMSPSSGISRCIAGPGSGKTRVLTNRIMFLIGVGEIPRSILSVTFTKKAADEMNERLQKLLGVDKTKFMTIGTFHSICARFLRKYGEGYLSQLTGYQSLNNKFTIYDENDSLQIIKKLIKEMNSILSPKDILNEILKIKEENIGTTSATTNNKNSNDFKSSNILINKMALQIINEYNKSLYSSNALDFTDLLLLCYRMLSTFPDVLDTIQTQYQHILVDEYQDTNIIQNEIVRLLTPKSTSTSTLTINTNDNNNNNNEENNLTNNNNDSNRSRGRSRNRSLFVAGDENQSIYSWRGAVPENMALLHGTFPSIVTYELKENYRSTVAICDVANAIIGKKVTIPYSSSSSGSSSIGESVTDTTVASVSVDNSMKCAPVLVINTRDEKHQAKLILQAICSTKNRDVAILYRTNAQSKILEDACVNANIPYKLIGGQKFYDRKEIKIILCYLRLLANPRDKEALRKIINTPTRGIGDKTQESFITWIENSEKEVLVYNSNLSAYETSQRKFVGDIFMHLFSLYTDDNITNTKDDENNENLINLSDNINNNNNNDFLKEYTPIPSDIFLSPCTLTPKEKKTLLPFMNIMKQLIISSNIKSITNLIFDILETINFSEYLNKISENKEEETDRNENIQELIRSAQSSNDNNDEPAKPSGNLFKFLDDINLMTNEKGSEIKENEKDNRISLMTIHASKGLEFKTVYITGFEEGTIPLIHNSNPESVQDDDSNVLEERRLAFVAVTRAKENLIILYRQCKQIFIGAGGIKTIKTNPSRFLKRLTKLPNTVCQFLYPK
eukprot:gene5275-10555_t